MEYCSATRKDEILPFATAWIDLGTIMLSRVSQTEKVRTIGFLSLMWNIKVKTTTE